MKTGVATLIIIFVCFIAAFNVAIAQYDALIFKRISSAEGLKDLTITSITEDKKGFIWFTSLSGVSRFNGYEIVHYYFSKQDSNSIPSNRVNCCFTDNKGTVWFGTEFGFCSYNEKQNTFLRHRIANAYKNQKNNVHAFTQINDSVLAIGTVGGLFFYNLNSQNIYKSENLFGNAAFNKLYINKLHFENGLLLISTRQGAFIFDTKLNTVQSYSAKENGNHHIEHDNIYASAIYNNKVWMLSYNAFVYSVDLKDNSIKMYDKLKDKSKGWNENQGLHCINDRNGNLWFGTLLSGLVRYNKHKDTFEYEQQQADNINSISDNHIRFIFSASNGILWIGTNSGISYVNPSKNYFTVLKAGNADKPKLLANWTRAFASDSLNRLWIATVKGVSVYNNISKTFTNFQNSASNKKLLSNNSIRALCADKNKYMWIGTANGLTRYDLIKHNFKSYKYDNKDTSTINGNFIVALLLTKKGTLYVGNNNGFCRYNGKRDYFERINSFSNTNFKFKFSARSIIEDGTGNIWIASPRNGLFKYNDSDNSLQVYNWFLSDSLSENENDVILSIASVHDSVIWIGTSSGLKIFDTNKKALKTISIHKELDVQKIANLIFDNQIQLWFTSNSGLVRYNPVNNSHRIFTVHDGLPTNDFNTQDAYKTTDGRLCFASMNGAVIFNPDKIDSLKNDLPFYITQVTSPENNKIWSYPFQNNDTLNFRYNENFFAVEFTALNFGNSHALNYSYKLEGFNPTWINNGSNRKVNFTNVPGGDYILKYRASTTDYFDDNFKTLYIHIDTVYYKTIWFRLLIAALAALLLYAIYRYRLNQKNKIQLMRNKIASDLHDEVGSTLSSISVYSEVLKQQNLNDEAKQILENIGNDSRSMIDSMSDIVWTINAENDSFEKVLQRMENYAYAALAVKNIEVNFNADEKLKQLELPMIARKNMYLIYKEAIHNASKYSNASVVKIEIKLHRKKVLLSIADNGVGFLNNGNDAKDVTRTFGNNGLKNMKRRAAEIGAFIIINSELSKGTQILLEIKIT